MNAELLYIWFDGEPGVSEADFTIPDQPGQADLDQLAQAIRDGRLGRYLPASFRYANHPAPGPSRVKSVDTARLLREQQIRHRRRYEVLTSSNQ
jgi:hypothetical protein